LFLSINGQKIKILQKNLWALGTDAEYIF
jgi:hypothetical protein